MLKVVSRATLKPGNWYWDETLDHVFAQSKQAIANLIQQGVRTFEPQRHTILATDWSKTGLGFALLQKHCSCTMDNAPNCCPTGWKLVFAGSRFTTEAESRYAPVEGEALAVTYALAKCRMFTLGCHNLTVVTDHKPLVKILGDCNLDNIKNPRLFSLKEKTLLYRYNIKHIPGTWHCAPDACSRNPTSSVAAFCASFCPCPAVDDSTTSSDLHTSAESHIRAALSGVATDDPYTLKAITMERVKESAQHDQEYIALLHVIEQGFPDRITSLQSMLHPYWKLRHELYCTNGVILYDGRVVIPTPLRKEVLECLHSAHQGVVGMKARARCSVFWPGLSNAITNRRDQCKTCNTIAPSQPREPLHPSPSPLFPFQLAVADYFCLNGHTYLAYADRYTGWVSICRFREATAETLKQELRTMFGIYGAPEELATDGGQPFASHNIQRFLRDWGVRWRQSSSYYPQSNGRAELAVKTAKRILQENTSANGDIHTDRVARALLQYRNTPLQLLNVSPAHLLYGRTLRDHMPSISDALRIRPEWQLLAEERERALAKRHLLTIERYNEHVKSLPELNVGTTVRVQNQTGPHPTRWDKSGTIAEIRDNGQYVVRLDGSGRCTLRNRRFLRQCHPFCSDAPLTEWTPDDAIPQTMTPPPLPAALSAPAARAPPATPDAPVALPALAAPAAAAESAAPPAPALRRSTRMQKPPTRLSMRLHGKAHAESDISHMDIMASEGGRGDVEYVQYV